MFELFCKLIQLIILCRRAIKGLLYSLLPNKCPPQSILCMSCLSLIKSGVRFSAAVSIRTNGFTESLPLTQQIDHCSSCQSEQRGRLCVYFCAIWSSAVTLSVCSLRNRDVSPVYAPGKPQQIQLHSGCSHWLPICLKGNAERTNCFLTPADSSPTATSYHYLTIISGLTVFDLEKKACFPPNIASFSYI